MSNRKEFAAAAAMALLLATGGTAVADEAGVTALPPARIEELPRVIVPSSSIMRTRDAGRRAHTSVRLLNVQAAPKAATSVASGLFETPASLACIYGLAAAASGCDPNIVTATATGGSRAIAVVDAYHYPTALADLTSYSNTFGLPAPKLQVVYAAGTQPPIDSTGGWELEAALDISMIHALAPNAQIILVEAASSDANDLFAAERIAGQLVAAAGGGEVSNSWGMGEFADESSFDSVFIAKNVVFFAATGDNPGTSYPSVSPNVVAVGGTSIGRAPATGYFEYEITWNSGGGGLSVYEPLPSYQKPIAGILGQYRGVPDLAMDANPETGVWVYDSTPVNGQAGWWVIGGTSASTPAAAAVVNAAGTFAASTAVELKKIYNARGNATYYRDIVSGACGPYEGYPGTKGWDFCTGVGAPIGLGGK